MTLKLFRKTVAILLIPILSLAAPILVAAESSKTQAIKIGFIAPLTGPFPAWGKSLREGLIIALEDTKHSFQVDYQDSECDAKKTLGIAQKMFSVNQIRLVIGPGCFTGLRVIAPLADRRKALLFSTGLLNDAIFKQHPSVINFATQISVEAEELSKFIASKGLKRISLLHGTNAFGEEFGIQLPALLKKNGVQVLAHEAVNLDTVDFRSLITRLAKNDAEAIFLHQGERQTINFMKQLRTLGFNIPVFSHYGMETSAMITEGAEKWTEGIIYTFPINSAELSEKKNDFDRRYFAKFGKDRIPTANSYYIYDGMMLLDQALDNCQAADTECISEFFRNTDQYEGLSGRMLFKKDGSNSRPYGIKTIRDGRFVWLTK